MYDTWGNQHAYVLTIRIYIHTYDPERVGRWKDAVASGNPDWKRKQHVPLSSFGQTNNYRVVVWMDKNNR
jgi:hypothetical protein